MKKSIKVLTYNKAGFDKAVKHALALGVTPTVLTFDPDKSSLVVILENGTARIVKSKAGYTPKKEPYAAIISLEQFKCYNHLNELIANKAVQQGVDPKQCQQDKAEAFSVGHDIGYDAGYDVGYDDGVTDTAPQTTLKCVECEVLVQNPIVWASMGIPFFKANGLELVESDGKMFTIDTKANTSTEFTAEEVAKQIKQDILDGKDTIYTSFAKNFELIDTAKYKKVLVDEAVTN